MSDGNIRTWEVVGNGCNRPGSGLEVPAPVYTLLNFGSPLQVKVENLRNWHLKKSVSEKWRPDNRIPDN